MCPPKYTNVSLKWQQSIPIMLSLGSITIQCNELLTGEPAECKVVYYYYVFTNPVYGLNYHISYYLQMTQFKDATC